MSAREHLSGIAYHMRALVKEALRSSETSRSTEGDLPGGEEMFSVFLAPDAIAINKARQLHLDSLGLEFSGKRILEVGAGIGLHTPFFLDRNCRVLSTDGNTQNVEEIHRRHPGREVAVLDLDSSENLRALGKFDIVYCYGLLYHLAYPERALAKLAEICEGQILLETCVSPGVFDEVVFVEDFKGNNQALSGIGCRPTRLWVMSRIGKFFGHAYITKTQPDHSHFPCDWTVVPTQLLYRAVFVGSKTPLLTETLTDQIPQQQERFRTKGAVT